jgi:hypothetical protein
MVRVSIITKILWFVRLEFIFVYSILGKIYFTATETTAQGLNTKFSRVNISPGTFAVKWNYLIGFNVDLNTMI